MLTTAGNAPDGSAGRLARDMLTAKMSKEQIAAEAQELLRQKTGGEASTGVQ